MAGRRPAARSAVRAAASSSASGCTRVTRPAASASAAPEQPPGRHEVERELLAGQPPQEHHHHRRDEASLDLRIAELGRGRLRPRCHRRVPAPPHPRVPDPAPPRPRGAGTAQPPEQWSRGAAHPASFSAGEPLGRGEQFIQIGTGAEILACATEHQHPYSGSRSTVSRDACSAFTSALLSAFRLSGRLSVSVQDATVAGPTGGGRSSRGDAVRRREASLPSPRSHPHRSEPAAARAARTRPDAR